MDVRTQPGDVYELHPNCIILYGDGGIALTLNQRNIETLRQVVKTQDCVKDNDSKDRRFTVAYNHSTERFRFEPFKGTGPIYVEGWAILPEIYQRKAA